MADGTAVESRLDRIAQRAVALGCTAAPYVASSEEQGLLVVPRATLYTGSLSYSPSGAVHVLLSCKVADLLYGAERLLLLHAQLTGEEL